MAAMTDEEILIEVVNALGQSGNSYLNDTLSPYLLEVKEFMKDAGVSEDVVQSSAAVGCITRGIIDLWNYGAGAATLSDYFKMRVTQLALK